MISWGLSLPVDVSDYITHTATIFLSLFTFGFQQN